MTRASAWTNGELIAELEVLVGTAGSADIAARLGYGHHPTTLARRLHRIGRHDLAVLFDRVEARSAA